MSALLRAPVVACRTTAEGRCSRSPRAAAPAAAAPPPARRRQLRGGRAAPSRATPPDGPSYGEVEWPSSGNAAAAAAAADAALGAFAENGNAAIVTGGLRRTPLSGGVQSATVKHDLPSPAVAVRNLMEQARYAHLCTVMSRMHHRRAGYPFGSLVDFATDPSGAPLLALSPLAIHTRNALAEPRCSMVVQMPGWSGLANARVTIFGDLQQLAPGSAEAAAAAEALRLKHAPPPGMPGAGPVAPPGAALLGNFLYFRMAHMTDIYFVGGFGTVQWVEVEEYRHSQPDRIVTRTGSGSPEATLLSLNAAFAAALPRLLRAGGSGARRGEAAAPIDEAALVSVDRAGVDVRVRRGGSLAVERLRFPGPVDTPQEAHDAVAALLRAADSA